MKATIKKIEEHLDCVRACSLCPNMVGPVVTPQAVTSHVYLCGQAPGPHEGRLGRPFAYTAGKTLFRWLAEIGADEETFRRRAFIGAVCRCFPGKTKQGADRVPAREEVEACSAWMQAEFQILEPKLVIAVGKLAIEQFVPPGPLVDVVGKQLRVSRFGHSFDLISLPHPSGASTWFKMEPGKSLLADALQLLGKHPCWKEVVQGR